MVATPAVPRHKPRVGYPAQKARAGAAEVADSTMVNAGAAAEAAETGPTRTKMDQLE